MSTPLVSIIIAVRNGQKTLDKCLDSISYLEAPDYEVIVVDDGSTDATPAILDKYKNVDVLRTEGVGPSVARNLAIKIAKGEYIAFTDADCIVDKHWITELWKGFTNDKIVAVGGDQRSPSDDSNFGKNVNEFMKCIGFVADYVKQSNKIIRTNHNPTCNVMYRRKVFDELHYGFLAGLWPGEDVELDHRLVMKKYRLMYNPKAIVYHYRVDNWKKYYWMMFNYGKVQAFLLKKYGLFRKIHYLPFMLILLIGSWLVYCSISSQDAVLVLLLGILIFMLYFLLKTKNIRKTMMFLRLFYNTVFSWNVGFWYGFLLRY